MNEEIKAKIAQYSELNIQIAKLKREADALKPALLEAMPPKTKIESEYGTISVSSRSSWEFSDVAQAMEDRLKQQQKQEKADGTAVEMPGAPFLVFKATRLQAS